MGERLAKKLWRLKELERILLEAHPQGLHNAELARRIEISRSEIPEYLEDLAALGVQVYDSDDGKHAIDPATHRVNLRLNLDESLAVLLAIRLLTTRSDKRNPHAAGALRELASAFDKLAPFIAQHIRQSANAVDGEHRRDDPLFLRWLERLTQAWATRVKVRLDYESDEGRFTTHTFSPYFIEPYAVGNTLHVLGLSEVVGKLLTLKVERIRNVELLTTPYNIPTDFDPTDILRDAWGIWRTEKEPERVVLRFDRRVAYRVRETQWHYLEKVDEDAQGNLIWTASISQPREMLPWIRGWGADCEVLEPEWLRRELKREAERLAKIYRPESARPVLPYELLWAKIDRKRPDQLHRLRYHLIDVGKCALALWETALPAVLKRQVAVWLGVGETEAGRLFAFWAALHDLGKASPVFQWHSSLPDSQRDRIKKELAQASFNFPSKLPTTDAHHATISTWALLTENLLPPQFSPELVKQFALAIGGHHGAWPQSNKLNNMLSDNSGEKLTGWREARQKLVEELLAVFQPPVIARFELDTERQNALLTLLSGVVAVADWLGSDDKIFGYEDGTRATADYAAQAAQNARRALDINKWRTLPELRPALDFATLFPGKTPRPTQAEALHAAAPLTPPALVILEAPMGSGKTEAALGMYAHWAHTADARGLYVAMPTMATSNQMHERVEAFLKQAYGADVSTLLIHSRAALKDALVDDTDQAGKDKAEQGERAAALTWFLPRKQSLLFPFGVGTVDQAFLSVLQTKHFFVRLLGLSHKVIIFDEVHAYDAYMNTLFKRLLEWLRQLGASVIILSATLPDKTRQDLAQAFERNAELPAAPAYPRLTWAAGGKADSVALPASAEPRRLQLEWMTPRDDNAIIARLRAELAHGGCAAVICNTVKRAQALYQALLDDNRREPWVENEDDLMLFHARFPFAWRDKKEKQVLAKFGPPDEKGNNKPERPEKAVLIATQVIEQSLDLDFDLMISDFAPTDFLLQRAGRLHRHTRNERPPLPDRLLIAAPTAEDGVPQFERYEIYERYVLLRSWLTVRRYGETMTLPNDLTKAIEQTYDDAREFAEATVAMREALEKAKEKMEIEVNTDRTKARKRLTRKPGDELLLWESETDLEEDDPTVNEAFQAFTRSDPPGISLVCLHQTLNGYACEPESREVIERPYEPDKETAKHMALYTVSIQHHDVIKYFAAKQDWPKVAALRHNRLAVFNNDFCPLEGTPYTLRLTYYLGLEIRKTEQETE